MPLWISIPLGLVAGLAILALVIVVAIRPSVAARPKQSSLADPWGNVDSYEHTSGDSPPGGLDGG